MPASAIQQRQLPVIVQEGRIQERSVRLCEELDACTEIEGVGRNKLKAFLLKTGISSIVEMDYPLRQSFREYLEYDQHIQRPERYLKAYDRVKQHSIREQMQTLAGRQQCRWQLEDKILFISYHPDPAIVKEFDSVWNRPNMVWDFTRACSRTLKQQIFTTLNAVIGQFKEPRWREQRLSGLRFLYDFCTEKGIADIEKLELEQIREFETWLEREGRTNSESRKQQMLPILNFCRKTVFLQNEEIHWDANIWYLERLHLPKNRVNPSGSFASISFLEIVRPDNRRYAQEYMKCQLGITGQAVSTLVTKYEGIRNFLVWLGKEDISVCECTENRIDTYLDQLQKRGIIAKTFNEYLAGLHHFFRFLMVRGYLEQVPFHPEYHQKKIIPKHHDRSVSPEVCMEILSKLHLLPEDQRCMYLHLWCLGLRISEVCTLKGNAYYRQGQDTWIQVYQIKMKKYKRIPIADGLYQIMQVYIRRKQIGPDDYLFTNKNGGPYRSATLQYQMKKFCRENGIEEGEYSFKSHDYRHTVATFFYDNGASLQSVRDYLGHNYEEMTEQYLDYGPRKIAKANDELFKEPCNRLAAHLEKKGGRNGR